MDRAKVSRIDIAHDLKFNTITETEAFISALNRIPAMGKIINYKIPGSTDTYDYRGYRCGDLVKAYIKNEDEKIPYNIRGALAPTVRIEIECKKNSKAKNIINQFSAEKVLRNPEIWSWIYNSTLTRLNFGGIILNKSSFDDAIETILKTYFPKSKPKKKKKYICKISSVLDGRTDPDRSTLRLLRLLIQNNLLPLCSDAVDTLLSTDIITATEQLFYSVAKERKNKTAYRPNCFQTYRSPQIKSVFIPFKALDSS